MSERKLTLGQPAKVLMHMQRKKGEWRLCWDRVPYFNNWGRRTEPTGIIAGVRNVYEGTTFSEEGFGIKFQREKVIRVYLVAINMASTLHVLPEDLMPLDGGGESHG